MSTLVHIAALSVALNVPTSRRGIMPQHMAQLRSRGFTVVDDFLPSSVVAELVSDVHSLQSQDRFASAGVGEASTQRVDSSVRVCEQCFVFPKGRQRTHRMVKTPVRMCKTKLVLLFV